MLSLWEYFWTEADWVPAPPPPPPDPTPGRGSGKGHHNKHATYQVLPDEYWEAYAERHKPSERLPPETLAERQARLQEEMRLIFEEEILLQELQTELISSQQSLGTAESIEALKTAAQYIKHLKEKISILEATHKARIIRAKSLRFSLYH